MCQKLAILFVSFKVFMALYCNVIQVSFLLPISIIVITARDTSYNPTPCNSTKNSPHQTCVWKSGFIFVMHRNLSKRAHCQSSFVLKECHKNGDTPSNRANMPLKLIKCCAIGMSNGAPRSILHTISLDLSCICRDVSL
jgi:hypothetical protein